MTRESALVCHGITWGYGASDVVHDVGLQVRSGEMTALVGPNGSGKSSLLRILAGLQKPRLGRVTVADVDMFSLGARARARKVAFVGQTVSAAPTEMLVKDIVGLGRLPHRRYGTQESESDRGIISESLAIVGLEEASDRRFDALSGGERQRVHLARAFAQQAEILVLDEPTNHLDIQHQIEIIHLVSGLGRTAVVAMHDLAHASRFCHRVAVLENGRLVTEGAPAVALTPDLIAQVFQVDARVAMTDEGEATLLFSRFPSERTNVVE